MMAISSDEEVRIRALELAHQAGTKRVLTRARLYYSFIKGDKERQQVAQPPPQYKQEDEAVRVAPMIRPN